MAYGIGFRIGRSRRVGNPIGVWGFLRSGAWPSGPIGSEV